MARGRGLRQHQGLTEIFNDPAVVAKQGGNPWDDPNYAWSQPKGGNEQLRNYLTNSDYWGYKDWDPLEQGGGRYIDRSGEQDLLEYMGANPNFSRDKLPRNARIQYPNTPEANMEYRLEGLFPRQGSNISPGQRKRQYLKAKDQENEMLRRMREDYKTSMGQDFLGEFTVLDRLRYMEEKGMNVPWDALPYSGRSVWAGHYGTGGGSTGGGPNPSIQGKKGGGPLATGGAPNPSPSLSRTAPVAPRPQAGPQAAASNPWGQQRSIQSRGPSRALGPRSPRRQPGRSLAPLFNPF